MSPSLGGKTGFFGGGEHSLIGNMIQRGGDLRAVLECLHEAEAEACIKLEACNEAEQQEEDMECQRIGEERNRRNQGRSVSAKGGGGTA